MLRRVPAGLLRAGELVKFGGDLVGGHATGNLAVQGVGDDAARDRAKVGQRDDTRLRGGGVELVSPDNRGLPDPAGPYTKITRPMRVTLVRRMNGVYPRAIDLAARGVVALDPPGSSRTPLTDAAHACAAAERRTGLEAIITP